MRYNNPRLWKATFKEHNGMHIAAFYIENSGYCGILGKDKEMAELLNITLEQFNEIANKHNCTKEGEYSTFLNCNDLNNFLEEIEPYLIMTQLVR